MRRILLPVALLVTAASLFLAFYPGSSSDTPDPGATTGPGAVIASSATEDDGQLPALDSAQGTERTPTADGDAPSPGHREAADTVRIVTGKVAVPTTCSDDEELAVYAWSEPVKEALSQLISTTEKGESIDGGATFLASSLVDSDRAFRIELTTDLDRVQLYVRGRFAYSREGHTTLLSEHGSEAYLPALCGACIEGEIFATSDEDREEMELHLVPTSSRSMVGDRASSRPQALQPDAEGRFLFTAIPAERAYELRILPEELAPELLDIAALAAGETKSVRFDLGAGGEVSGRVVGPEGLPISAAEVVSRGGRGAVTITGWVRRKTETAEDGTFTLVGLPSGSIVVVAEKEGFLTSGFESLTLRGGEEIQGLELTLGEGNSIEGSVHWPDGVPIADATIEVEFDRAALVGADSINAARGGSGSATTDAEGSFRVTALGLGPFTVSVSHTPTGGRLEDWLRGETQLSALREETELDEEAAFAWSDQAQGIRPGEAALEFVLSAPQVVAGSVVNDIDAAVEEFEVILVRVADTALGKLGVDTIRHDIEDTEGRFLIPGVSPAEWKIYAQAEGYSTSEAIVITTPLAEGTEPLRITLEPACTASGVVLTPAGIPATGAQVRIAQGVARLLETVSDDLKNPTARSAVGGEFRLEGLHSGFVELIASAEGYAESEPQQVTLTAGKESADIRLKLRRGGTITGVLYDSEGNLTPGATVQVILSADYTTDIKQTDAEGSFRFENLKPGTWQVVGIPNLMGALSDSEDNQGGRAAVLKDLVMGFAELEDGAEVHVVLGALPEDPVLLSGVVRHRGEPVPGATLVLILEGEAVVPKIEISDGEGRYSARLDKPGDYLLTVQILFGGGYQQHHQNTFKAHIPPTPEHRWDIDLPGAGIRGRVTNSDGSVAAGVPIRLSPDYAKGYSPSSTATATNISTKEDGSFEIDSVQPGSYHLRAGGLSLSARAIGAQTKGASHMGSASMSLSVAEDQLIEGADFVLEQGGSIDIRVVDAAGDPITGASIFVRTEDGRPTEMISVATTNSQGLCHYPGLAEGDYQVSARTKDAASAEGASAHVRAGETTEVELALAPATLLRVTMVDGEGDPVAALLRVVDSEGREHASYTSLVSMYARMGEDGFSGTQQTIGPLPPGRYRVHAYADDGRETDKPVNLRGQAERSIRLRFR